MVSNVSHDRKPVFTRMPEDHKSTWPDYIWPPSSSKDSSVPGRPIFTPMPIDHRDKNVLKETEAHNKETKDSIKQDHDDTESRPLILFRLEELLPDSDVEDGIICSVIQDYESTIESTTLLNTAAFPFVDFEGSDENYMSASETESSIYGDSEFADDEYDEYDEGDCTQDSSQVPLEGIFVDEENGLVVS